MSSVTSPFPLWRPRAFRRGPTRLAATCAILLCGIAVMHHARMQRPFGHLLARNATPAVEETLAWGALLESGDVAAYRLALRAQKQRDWDAADAALAQVETPILHPTLLAQRYTDAKTKPEADAFATWLSAYPDHPSWNAVMARAGQLYPARFPRAERTAASPSLSLRPAAAGSEPLRRYGDAQNLKSLSAADRAEIERITDAVQKKLADGKIDQAIAHSHGRGLSTTAQDLLAWQLANSFFAYGQTAVAERIGGAAADRSGKAFPSMHWVAGMAAWQRGDYAIARKHFHSMALAADKLKPADAAAAHFWAARAWKVTGEEETAKIFLEHAASYGEQFYAYLARAQLNRAASVAPEYLHHTQLLAQGRVNAAWLELHPGVARALAWHQLGQPMLAQWELAHAYRESGDEDRAVVAYLAGRMDLPGLQLAMARQLPPTLARLSSYPVPSWEPHAGYTVEPPLLLGMARQESGFDSTAISPAGARGLMQMMPQTARYVAAMQPFAPGQRTLADPATSLTLGQRYLHYLAEKPYVDGNLILLLAAYNAGPKPTIAWAERQRSSTDPLAFIESLGFSETRAYVQQVLANSWTYHTLLGTEPTSLQALARGQWPSIKTERQWFAATPRPKPAELASGA